MSDNIIKIIIDDAKNGAEESEIDLDKLTLEELYSLGSFIPEAMDLYFQKMLQSDK